MSVNTGRVGTKRDHVNDFDMNSPEFNEEYEQVVLELPVTCPVARSEVGHGYYVLNRYEDVRAAAKDWRTFSSAKGHVPNRPDDLPYLYPEESDPPYHNVWRRVLNKHFSPAMVAQHSDAINGYIDELLNGFVDNGECDFVAQFAGPLPAMVFTCCLLGLPRSEAGGINQAVYEALDGPVEGRQAGWMKCAGYMQQCLEQRSAGAAQGDFIDTVLEGVEFEGAPCPPEHKLSILTLVLAGGVGTTTYVLSGMAHHLAQHPEDRLALLENPELRPRAIEEFIRYYTAVGQAGRVVTQDTELAGQQFRAGDWLTLGLASACRDAAVFDDPGRIDIFREVNRHAAFGFGPHRCLGEHLARQEVGLALDALLRRLPAFRMRPGSVPQFETGISRSMKNLDLIWEVPR